MKAYREALAATSRRTTPWYVIPADHKWFAHVLIAEIILKTLEDLDLAFPKLTSRQRRELRRARRRLAHGGLLLLAKRHDEGHAYRPRRQHVGNGEKLEDKGGQQQRMKPDDPPRQ